MLAKTQELAMNAKVFQRLDSISEPLAGIGLLQDHGGAGLATQCQCGDAKDNVNIQVQR